MLLQILWIQISILLQLKYVNEKDVKNVFIKIGQLEKKISKHIPYNWNILICNEKSSYVMF